MAHVNGETGTKIQVLSVFKPRLPRAIPYCPASVRLLFIRMHQSKVANNNSYVVGTVWSALHALIHFNPLNDLIRYVLSLHPFYR